MQKRSRSPGLFGSSHTYLPDYGFPCAQPRSDLFYESSDSPPPKPTAFPIIVESQESPLFLTQLTQNVDEVRRSSPESPPPRFQPSRPTPMTTPATIALSRAKFILSQKDYHATRIPRLSREPVHEGNAMRLETAFAEACKILFIMNSIVPSIREDISVRSMISPDMTFRYWRCAIIDAEICAFSSFSNKYGIYMKPGGSSDKYLLIYSNGDTFIMETSTSLNRSYTRSVEQNYPIWRYTPEMIMRLAMERMDYFFKEVILVPTMPDYDEVSIRKQIIRSCYDTLDRYGNENSLLKMPFDQLCKCARASPRLAMSISFSYGYGYDEEKGAEIWEYCMSCILIYSELRPEPKTLAEYYRNE